MKSVTIHDAKTNLSKYVAPAKKGKQVYIGGFGIPEALLIKLPVQESTNRGERSFIHAKGKVTEKACAFSATTDQSIAALMYDHLHHGLSNYYWG
jgi:antitoxin (DNA-binding transcriptional repressor) of toxin-antitoxin stability system